MKAENVCMTNSCVLLTYIVSSGTLNPTIPYLLVGRADLQKHLRYLSRAAESIAVGDTIDAVVRRGQKWNMLPTQVS